MLKVVVFDSGWGGEMFADYLEKKVPVVEVMRVIDWRKAPYSEKGRTDICVLAEKALKPYIGTADVIVLASYAVTVAALSYLKWKYPEQKFVGFELDLSEYLAGREMMKPIMVLATGVVEKSVSFERELAAMGRYKVIRPKCGGWIKKVDDGEMTERELRRELGKYEKAKVGMILVYSTGLADLGPAFREIYGRSVVVVDDFLRVTHKTCMALELRGADGLREKGARLK